MALQGGDNIPKGRLRKLELIEASMGVLLKSAEFENIYDTYLSLMKRYAINAPVYKSELSERARGAKRKRYKDYIEGMSNCTIGSALDTFLALHRCEYIPCNISVYMTILFEPNILESNSKIVDVCKSIRSWIEDKKLKPGSCLDCKRRANFSRVFTEKEAYILRVQKSIVKKYNEILTYNGDDTHELWLRLFAALLWASHLPLTSHCTSL